MKQIPKFILLFFLGLIAVATIYQKFFSSESLRYRVTVVVETPEGIKTGSAVREASKYSEISIFPGSGGVFHNVIKGEAVVVDLGQRGILFSLIGGEHEAREVFRIFEKRQTNKANLAPKYSPMLVHFGDLNNPSTVEGISSYKEKTHLDGYSGTSVTTQTVFGAGVILKETFVEVVDDEITTGIKQRLPWLGSTKGYISGKKVSGKGLRNHLDRWHFIKGDKVD